MGKSSYLQQIEFGLAGNAIGLPNGLGSMNEGIFGTQQSRYYLFGGESGSGKTTIVDYCFILCPYFAIREDEQYSKFKVNWEYFSFEQSARTKQSKWASHIIKRKHDIWIPPALALGKTKSRLTKEQYSYCVEANDTLEEMFDSINLIDHPTGPTGFVTHLINYGRKKGKWITKPRLDANGSPVVNKMKKPIMDIIGWEANDPLERHNIAMDHVAYADLEKRTLKENIDYISRTCVKFRELCGWTFIIIQQFNTGLASVERQKFKKSALAPQRVDFGDSTYSYQDADVVFGILNPYKYDILDNYQGYDNIIKFNGLATWMFLMKNRHDGPANISIPYLMDPVGLTVSEIPDPEETKVLVQLGSMEDPLEEFYEIADQIYSLKKQYI